MPKIGPFLPFFLLFFYVLFFPYCTFWAFGQQPPIDPSSVTTMEPKLVDTFTGHLVSTGISGVILLLIVVPLMKWLFSEIAKQRDSFLEELRQQRASFLEEVKEQRRNFMEYIEKYNK